MTAIRVIPRTRPGLVYVLAVATATALLCALANAGVIPPEVVGLIAVPLGPIGLVLGLLLLLVGAGVAASGDLPLLLLAVIDVVVLVAVLAVARLNVGIVSGIRRRAAQAPVPVRYRGRVPLAWDRILGVGAFITAGMLFVGLCVVAGFIALVAGGIDVPTPVAQAAAARAACAVGWLLGLVAAVGGIVLWVVTARRGQAMLRWAIADLGVQALALTGVIAFSTAVSG